MRGRLNRFLVPLVPAFVLTMPGCGDPLAGIEKIDSTAAYAHSLVTAAAGLPPCDTLFARMDDAAALLGARTLDSDSHARKFEDDTTSALIVEIEGGVFATIGRRDTARLEGSFTGSLRTECEEAEEIPTEESAPSDGTQELAHHAVDLASASPRCDELRGLATKLAWWYLTEEGAEIESRSNPYALKLPDGSRITVAMSPKDEKGVRGIVALISTEGKRTRDSYIGTVETTCQN